MLPSRLAHAVTSDVSPACHTLGVSFVLPRAGSSFGSIISAMEGPKLVQTAQDLKGVDEGELALVEEVEDSVLRRDS